jgi:hypothetical protein
MFIPVLCHEAVKAFGEICPFTESAMERNKKQYFKKIKPIC